MLMLKTVRIIIAAETTARVIMTPSIFGQSRRIEMRLKLIRSLPAHVQIATRCAGVLALFLMKHIIFLAQRGKSMRTEEASFRERKTL